MTHCFERVRVDDPELAKVPVYDPSPSREDRNARESNLQDPGRYEKSLGEMSTFIHGDVR